MGSAAKAWTVLLRYSISLSPLPASVFPTLLLPPSLDPQKEIAPSLPAAPRPASNKVNKSSSVPTGSFFVSAVFLTPSEKVRSHKFTACYRHRRRPHLTLSWLVLFGGSSPFSSSSFFHSLAPFGSHHSPCTPSFSLPLFPPAHRRRHGQ